MSNFYYSLDGEIVPKARPRGGNGRHYLPQNYRDWKDYAIWELQKQHTGTAIAGPVSVDIVLLGKHSRRGDGDNIAGSIWDAMVQAGILSDDNLKCVPAMSLALYWSSEPAIAMIKVSPAAIGVPPSWCGELANHP